MEYETPKCKIQTIQLFGLVCGSVTTESLVGEDVRYQM